MARWRVSGELTVESESTRYALDAVHATNGTMATKVGTTGPSASRHPLCRAPTVRPPIITAPANSITAPYDIDVADIVCTRQHCSDTSTNGFNKLSA